MISGANRRWHPDANELMTPEDVAALPGPSRRGAVGSPGNGRGHAFEREEDLDDSWSLGENGEVPTRDGVGLYAEPLTRLALHELEREEPVVGGGDDVGG